MERQPVQMQTPEGPEERHYFSLWLYTYESLVAHADWVIEFVEETFTFADPFALDLQFVADIRPRGKEVRRKFTPNAWEWCKEELKRGRLWLALTHPKTFAAPKTIFPLWSVNLLSTAVPRPQRKPNANAVVPYWQLPAANELRLVLELPLTVERIDGALQERLVKFGRNTFVRTRATYGFINLSRRPVDADAGGTKYERSREIFAIDNLHLLHQKVRGAFWENYLTEGHIQKLGGIREVREKAPCARIDELAKGKALALRLTKDINAITGADVSKLEAYFEPLAPSREEFEPSRRPK